MKHATCRPSVLRAIDLFCGAGGSSWGAKQAGVEIIAGFDQWEVAGENYALNFPGATFHPGRLEDVNLVKIKKGLGKVDLILASPECTNHSGARGSRPRCEKSRETAFQVLRFASAIRPRWIVIENVVSMRRWTRYEEFAEGLRELEYEFREQVLNSADFGVPQSRRRLFLVCEHRHRPDPVEPLPGPTKTVAPLLDLDGTYGWTPLRSKSRARATLKRANLAIRTAGPNEPFLIVYYGTDQAGGWQPLSRPLRTITTLDRFALVKPSPQGHMMRMLQVPELQLAMGMDGMRFEYGTRRDRIKMIGNAVCPPVMRAVITQLMGTQ